MQLEVITVAAFDIPPALSGNSAGGAPVLSHDDRPRAGQRPLQPTRYYEAGDGLAVSKGP
ncbi:MAG: hypothetical protein H8E45_11840 [Proteobacteria bacterium]|nr:hypothetical protein [Pseudomonadota bacterium]